VNRVQVTGDREQLAVWAGRQGLTPTGFRYIAAREARFKPETESRLNEVASKGGRPTHELVEDAMAAYLAEAPQVRGMLDSRYDDLKSARVKGIDGEEAFDRLLRKDKSPGQS